MNGKILSLAVIVLMMLGSFGAIGTHSEIETENDCGCGNFETSSSISGDNSVFVGLSSKDIVALQQQGEIEGWTYTVGENSATKYSIDELCGLVEPADWRVNARFDPCTLSLGLPDYFDWRELGGVTPIRDQGQCGSCWAFGTVGPLECNILIKDGIEKDLSEQWLVSCNQDGWDCDGGWWAHDYHMWKKDPCGDTGAVLEQYFPYVASNAPCNCPYPHDYFITDWAFIGSEHGVPSVDAIKQAIYDYGPVSAAVCVNSAFQAYNGGIFNGPSCDDVNHAVVLVGWDDNQGTNGVWFLRNSWDDDWGEDGYMRIEYGTSEVGYAANYVDYEPAPGNVRLTVRIQKLTNDPALGDFDQIDHWWWPNTEEPEWYYRVGVKSGSETRYQHAYNKDPNSWWFPWISEYTWNAKRDHPFGVSTSTVEVTIKLMDHDGVLEGGFDDLADVSAHSGGGVDNSIDDVRGAIYTGTYNIVTNELTGDTVGQDGSYFTTNGEDDGSTGTDENDAKVWFKITDTYYKPDLDCDGSLSWTDIEPGKTVTGSFKVKNAGEPGSKLDWEVKTWPSWGTWTFTPSSGTGLTPAMGWINVDVEVIAPDEQNTEFEGEVKVINSDDSSDFCIIPVSLSTPKNQNSQDSQQNSNQQSKSSSSSRQSSSE